MTCGIVSCVFNDNGECVLKNPNTCEIMRLINRDKAKEPIQYGDENEPILRCPSCEEDVTDLIECGFNFCPHCGKNPVVEGRKLCKECAEENIKNLKKANDSEKTKRQREYIKKQNSLAFMR